MSDSGHPSRFGYVMCKHCGCWRPIGKMSTAGFCLEWGWCSLERMSAMLGWDANRTPTTFAVVEYNPTTHEPPVFVARSSASPFNGAPTGVDANGDAT